MYQILPIAICLLLVVTILGITGYSKVQSENVKKWLHHLLRDLITKQQLQPAIVDQWQHQLLAIDPVKKKLVHLTEKDMHIIDMAHIKSCQLIFKLLTIQLELVYLAEGEERSQTIVFYRRYIDKKSKRRSLTRKAKKWEARILENLSLTARVKPALPNYNSAPLKSLNWKIS